MREPSFPAAEQCPLCGQPNGCAMEAQRRSGRAQPACWCTGIEFDADLIARVPEQAKGRACVCRACANDAGSA